MDETRLIVGCEYSITIFTIEDPVMPVVVKNIEFLHEMRQMEELNKKGFILCILWNK